MNILVCYMPKTDLRIQSYGTMNMGIWIWEFRGLSEIIPPETDLGFRARRSRWGRAFAGVSAGARGEMAAA